ncbi:MAG: carbonic anhydrase family protein [Piscinibacter sp.]|uniref:carbonic anhydrase n=1 Tax=Piscinibacter sp. TaxID=1903157 RepID=UPI001B54FF38|nr:carbonic anhydrase family protein [Piscinibacter sp.]MBP5991977.1 carbonic anhydrase family protein [Piscinibacter sp.]MBP6029431.1 carbonic anhydrase family protein [Piscinibacter sp.]
MRTRFFLVALVALVMHATAAADAPAGEARPEVKPEAKPAKAEARPPARAEMPDPMDRLRERLAEKLGATKAAPTSPNVLRVAARAEPESAPAVAAAKTAAPKQKPAAAPKTEHAHAAHWGYEGEGGPASWGAMKPEFAKCASGTRQSPIDIREGIKVQLDLVPFDYKPSAFRVIDNGHTVQVNVAPGNSIEVMGRRYELAQFHFHRPSEERIDGRQFDMVVHLVHKDPEGRLAVVAVLLERGSAQPVVQKVWNNLPLEKGEEVPARDTLDLAALLPSERSYFTYMGSLTTPPCSEGVLWMVMKQPVAISPEQIGIFARLYPMNARPIQSAAGRLIKESN